ncbi:hypothetical protein JD516_06865 [Aeromonas jandaei]|uniref:hypothetical protein n=1 Tax=Aeromonas jandaei TaxID=650 RepID=UPI00191FD374|nr:hypothetical protein [Aeromonas jandaei]MBL0597541.1 hypothetical protein [Aeromonas jandaei]
MPKIYIVLLVKRSSTFFGVFCNNLRWVDGLSRYNAGNGLAPLLSRHLQVLGVQGVPRVWLTLNESARHQAWMSHFIYISRQQPTTGSAAFFVAGSLQ